MGRCDVNTIPTLTLPLKGREQMKMSNYGFRVLHCCYSLTYKYTFTPPTTKPRKIKLSVQRSE